MLSSRLDRFRLPPHRSGPAGIALYSTMCRERLDQFCDRHDLVLRAALLVVPALIYGAYIAWAADRFDFICGSLCIHHGLHAIDARPARQLHPTHWLIYAQAARSATISHLRPASRSGWCTSLSYLYSSGGNFEGSTDL